MSEEMTEKTVRASRSLVPARDAARKCGRSLNTLRRWTREGHIKVADWDTTTGEPLYTRDEVERMTDLLEEIRVRRMKQLHHWRMAQRGLPLQAAGGR